MSQGQFHKAFAVLQGNCVLARHGAQGLCCTSHHDDDGIATPIFRQQVIYGIPIDRADAWERGKDTVRSAHRCTAYLRTQSSINLKTLYVGAGPNPRNLEAV